MIAIPIFWIPVIIFGATYFLGDRILNMLIVREQVGGFVSIIGILTTIVLALLLIYHLKQRGKGGDDRKDE